MNILWITNTIFPAPSMALGIQSPVIGGWMYALATKVSTSPGICLAVASTFSGTELYSLNTERIIYYLLPSRSADKYQKKLESHWKSICNKFQPDIVHIHGTEFMHGLACIQACPELKYIVSIQGMIGIYARYFHAGIDTWDILKNITLRDIVKSDTIFQGMKRYKRRGKFESMYLQRTSHVIGRTSWDYVHSKVINPNINYHFCNESLRNSFYIAEKWNISQKNDYTIFCSQALYPIKGLHQVIKAVSMLITEFPRIKVRIAGKCIINNKSIIEKIKFSGYGNYVCTLLKRLNLFDFVHFTGILTEEQMVAEYKNAHLFICPSSIENSPNSVGESQILGVPTIAAYVGGIPDMVVHGESGLLYRFEEIEMLAENIRRVFTNDLLANHLSVHGIQAAEIRHNTSINLKRTLEIYDNVLNS
jgi:glycosyltransferase involved in cell wall biosynthesis